MRSLTLFVFIGAAAVAVVASCTPSPPSQPSPSGGTGPVQAPAPAVNPAAPVTNAPRRRPPPNPVAQDSSRRSMVDSILKTIAGRENEPAGRVFKNVLLLKDMPAGEFLRNMDTNYGRGLGWTCSNCHVVGQFDVDTRKNKRIARQMQALNNLINDEQLPKIKELDATYEKVSCVMCHRGDNEPKATMPVPPPPRPTASPGPGQDR